MLSPPDLNGALRDVFARIRHFSAPMLADHASARIEVAGHFGASRGDAELVADRLMRDITVDALRGYAPLKSLIREFVAEGHEERIGGHADGPYVAYIDQLDNSQGYRARMRARGSAFCPSPHPYACVITLVDERPGTVPLFGDIVAGGMQALHALDVPHQSPIIGVRDLMWHADYRPVPASKPLFFDRMVDGKKVGIGINRTVIVEGYYEANRIMLARDFGDVTGPIRSVGCAGLEMGMVAAGYVDAFVSPTQKLDELGAGACVNRAAGTAICTWNEERDPAYESRDNPNGLVRRRVSLWDQPFAWGTKRPIIFASDETVMAELCGRMHIH